MKIKYCLPIIKKTVEEVETVIETHKDSYNYFEIWGGHLRGFSTGEDERVWSLAKKYKGKLILLMRNKNLEDTLHLLEGEKEMMLSCFLQTGELVDIDIHAQKNLLDNILIKETKNPNLILSYHNYTQTPKDEYLSKIILEMEEFNPQIYKISTYCQTEEDAIRLLALQQKLKKKGYRHIILGMGEYGKITRVFGTLFGNEMIFAPDDKKDASAPGQMTKQELETVFKIINNQQ